MDKTPITAGNFLTLTKDGFYAGTKFHRVIDNFMIQGGDPNSRGDDEELYGRGGPGYTIEDEFVDELSNLRGTISMANIGQPNTGGSQFFINYTNNIGLDFDKEPLTSKHPVFGQVVEGLSVVDAIAKGPTDNRDIPLEPVTILDVEIHPGVISSEKAEEKEVFAEEKKQKEPNTEESIEENTEEGSDVEDIIEGESEDASGDVSYLNFFDFPTLFSL